MDPRRRLPTRLNCTECRAFVQYWTEANGTTVRCEDCGKRHSTKSLYVIDPDRDYRRDEAGILLEEPP